MGIPPMEIGEEQAFLTKIRYNHKGANARIKRIGEDEILCHFDEPVRAVTPGQAVVFYQDGVVAGGGVILDTGAQQTGLESAVADELKGLESAAAGVAMKSFESAAAGEAMKAGNGGKA